MRIVLGCLHEELFAVSLMVLTARSLGGEWSWYSFRVSHLQGTIHLVGRNVVEALAIVALWQTLPICLSCLEQGQRTHHVGMCEGEWVLDASVHMTLGCKMDNAIYMLILHQLQEGIKVADIHLDKLVVWLVLDVREVCQVTGIGQLIEVDDVVLRIFVHEKAYYV